MSGTFLYRQPCLVPTYSFVCTSTDLSNTATPYKLMQPKNIGPIKGLEFTVMKLETNYKDRFAAGVHSLIILIHLLSSMGCNSLYNLRACF